MIVKNQNLIAQTKEETPIKAYKKETLENSNEIENKQNIKNKKEKDSECKLFWKPDCCFCSESGCCNCSNQENYPAINIPNAIFFTLLSNLSILFIIYLFTPQNHFKNFYEFFSLKLDKIESALPYLYIVFGIELIIYSPFSLSIWPFIEGCKRYPSWAKEECFETIFNFITVIQCCCCIYCCCLGEYKSDFLKFTSKCVRYIYKTGFYFYNIFFIPTIIIYHIYGKDEKICQKRAKQVFDVFLSFILTDFITFIHSIIYGNRINHIRNGILCIVGVIISFFLYYKFYEIKICGYLMIPTVYYYILMNVYIYFMNNQWRESLYPLYGSVGFLFTLLSIPIIIIILALSLIYFFKENCSCDSSTSSRHITYSNNERVSTPSHEPELDSNNRYSEN